MILKRFARDLLYWSSEATGRLKSREASMSGVLTVLTYHRILPDAEARACPFPSLAMPETWFREQMEWLGRNARVLPLTPALADRAASGPPLVAVTFDDGYFDNAEIAAPVLKSFGLKGTFFICTAPVRTGSRFWYDSIAEGSLRWGNAALRSRLVSTSDSLAGPLADSSDAHAIVAALKRAPDRIRREAVAAVERDLGAGGWTYRSHVMTVDQMRALKAEGHEIGSHTETHPILPQLEPAEAAAELGASRKWLEETLGRPVTGFCYPNGDHSPATREWVTRAGYAYACVTEEGANASGFDPFRIRRIDVAPNRVGNCVGRGSVRSFRALISRLRRPTPVGSA